MNQCHQAIINVEVHVVVHQEGVWKVSAMRPEYATKGGNSPRVAMLNRRNDQIMQTNLPVIPNQRWVQQNFMAKV